MEPTSISLIANLPFEVAASCIESLVLHTVLDPAICRASEGISLVPEPWLLLPSRTVQKLGMQDEAIKNDATSLVLASRKHHHLLYCIFHLKATTLSHPPPRFHRGPPSPLTECSMQGSQSLERFRESRGPEGREGHNAVKCLNVASFPHFNWAI